jgi:hypothetical protein
MTGSWSEYLSVVLGSLVISIRIAEGFVFTFGPTTK